ncbi:hypothetical protein B0H14DRAFT_2567308 [Mycena olivaceomarginata]|nr:hypothetical protein B0H14DRAFT_2567308 [Mycena olivaceomarginata]
MVKTLYRIRLIAVVEPFIGHENIKTFFDVLEASNSAIGGSAIPRMLTPPLRENEDWMPSNLNIYIPLGAWNRTSTQIRDNGFVQYESRLPGHPIMLSESIDACVITPAVAASTTLVMYPELVIHRRAHSGWHRPNVESCIKLQDRGFRHSVSTVQWNQGCGWNCPSFGGVFKALKASAFLLGWT